MLLVQRDTQFIGRSEDRLSPTSDKIFPTIAQFVCTRRFESRTDTLVRGVDALSSSDSFA